MRQPILTNEESNTTAIFGFNGGLGLLVVSGVDFDSATAKLQLRDPEGGAAGGVGPWNDVPDASFTANGYAQIQAQAGVEYQIDISGGSESTQDITVALFSE